MRWSRDISSEKLPFILSSTRKTESKSRKMQWCFKEFYLTEPGETFKSCSTLAVGSLFPPTVSRPSRAAMNSRFHGILSLVSAFFFLSVFLHWLLDLKLFPHSLNQILEQYLMSTVYQRETWGFFFRFLQDKDTTDRTCITERGRSMMSQMEAGGAQGARWADTSTSFLQGLMDLDCHFFPSHFVAPKKCLSGVWRCHLFLTWGLPPLAMAF